MADKTFTVNPGDEIIISVPRRQPSGNEILMRRPPAPRAMIRTRRTNEFLPRRLKKSASINFFDTGQIKNGGGWSELPYAVEFPIVFPLTSGIRPLTNEDFAGVDETVFEKDLSAFASEYRKITKPLGEYYRIKISGDGFSHTTESRDAAWGDGGLNLTDAELNADNFRIETTRFKTSTTGKLFHDFVLTGAGKNKITAVRNYDADAVSFTPGKKDSYFLLPVLVFPNGNAYADRNPDTDFVRVFIEMGYLLGIYPRLLEPYGDDAAIVLPFETPDRFVNTDAEYVRKSEIFRNRRGLRGAKSYRADVSTPPVETLFSAADFAPSDAIASVIDYYDIWDSFSAEFVVLAAVIKQGENYFYVWSKS